MRYKINKATVQRFCMLMLMIPAFASCSDDMLDEFANGLHDTRSYAENYQNSLLRTYGVGYGYDATGQFVNYNSVRDCVIDVQELKKLEGEQGISYLTDNLTPRTEMHVCEGFDSEELARNLSVSAGLELNLAYFQGEVSASYESSMLKTDYYSFCTIRNNYIQASRHIDPLMIQALAESHPEIISKGFRSRVDRILQCIETGDKAGNAEMAIDTLLLHYGTHFIYQASLGGALVFNSTFAKKSLAESENLSFSAKAQICKLCSFEIGETDTTTVNQRQEATTYTLTANGGKASLATRIFSQSGEKLPKELLQAWYESIHFDPADEKASNVELVDFRLAPIYELISNEKVRNRVAERFGVYREKAEAAMPRPEHPVFDIIPLRELGISTYNQNFARIVDPQVGVIAEVTTEFIPVDGQLHTVSTFYPVIGGVVAEEGLSLILADSDEIPEEDANVDQLYVTSWMEDTVVNVSTLFPAKDVEYLYYNNGQLGVRPIEGRQYKKLNAAENVQTNNLIYCWDGYYGEDMYKVGGYYVMSGPVLEVNQENEDRANDYHKVLLDPPYGWEFASPRCGVFQACRLYLEKMLANTSEFAWMSNMLLVENLGSTGGVASYGFSLFDPGNGENNYVVRNESEVQETLRDGITPVMLVRQRHYTYR